MSGLGRARLQPGRCARENDLAFRPWGWLPQRIKPVCGATFAACLKGLPFPETGYTYYETAIVSGSPAGIGFGDHTCEGLGSEVIAKEPLPGGRRRESCAGEV